MFRTLISAGELNALLGGPDLRVVDCRFDLAAPEAGEAAWRVSHIPGAVYAHLDRDLSSAITPLTGRHPLPDPGLLVQRLGEWGIEADTQVVAYDASGGAMAARLWWLLRWLGHERVAVLDGGWVAWRAKGLAMNDRAPVVRRVSFRRREALSLPLSVADVQDVVNGDAQMCLVDARAAPRYRGDVEPIDTRAGHIPGAINRPFAENLDVQGCFLAPELLRKRFAQVPPEKVIHYCGSGVTASHNVLAMEHAGLPGSRLYAGSWSEWIRDPARPVERGA